MDPGIGAPLPPSIPSIWDPNALFCFPSARPGPIEVPVPFKGAGSPLASTHPQEHQQQQQAQRVHGAAGGTCPHRPTPAAAPGFQLVRSADKQGCATLQRPPPGASLGSAPSGWGREGLEEASAAAPPPPRPPPEPRPPAPPPPGGERRGREGVRGAAPARPRCRFSALRPSVPLPHLAWIPSAWSALGLVCPGCCRLRTRAARVRLWLSPPAAFTLNPLPLPPALASSLVPCSLPSLY